MTEEIITPPLPRVRGEEARYFELMREHSLSYQRCGRCEGVVFPFRAVCPFCGVEDLQEALSSGEGTVYSYTVQHRAPGDYLRARLPIVLALIDLREGFRMMADIVDCPPDEVRIGLPVEVVFDDVTPEVTLARFRPSMRGTNA